MLLDPLDKRAISKKNKDKRRNTHFGHAHPSSKLILVRIVIPEVRIHNGELVVCKARRENLITIKGLHPSINNGRGR